jgi:hypothetical protein
MSLPRRAVASASKARRSATVFNIALTDIPEKRSDFVEGRYTLPAPTGETNVAVKITDMLGEEVVVQKTG